MSAFAARPQPSSAKNGYSAQPEQIVQPIVAAIDGSAASDAAIGEAVRVAVELAAPIVFAYVRRRPAGFFGAPFYQRRLTKEMASARGVLDLAVGLADSAGVTAEGEILEGSPRRRITEFARDRNARLIVVGSRRRKLGQSVSTAVVRSAGRPVIVARSMPRLTAMAYGARSRRHSPASVRTGAATGTN